MQWLRGWVPPAGVHDEFTRLENHIASVQNACEFCADQPVRCRHVKAKFADKIRELGRNRTLKPFILANSMSIFMEFCAVIVMRPYIIQIVKAYGIPLNPNFTATALSLISIVGNCCFLISVKVFGKRHLYLASTAVAILCCFGLSKKLSLRPFLHWKPNLLNFRIKLFNLFIGRCLRLCILPTELDVIQEGRKCNTPKLWSHTWCCWKLWLFSCCTSFCLAILLQFGLDRSSVAHPRWSLFDEVIWFS